MNEWNTIDPRFSLGKEYKIMILRSSIYYPPNYETGFGLLKNNNIECYFESKPQKIILISEDIWPNWEWKLY